MSESEETTITSILAELSAALVTSHEEYLSKWDEDTQNRKMFDKWPSTIYWRFPNYEWSRGWRVRHLLMNGQFAAQELFDAASPQIRCWMLGMAVALGLHVRSQDLVEHLALEVAQALEAEPELANGNPSALDGPTKLVLDTPNTLAELKTQWAHAGCSLVFAKPPRKVLELFEQHLELALTDLKFRELLGPNFSEAKLCDAVLDELLCTVDGDQYIQLFEDLYDAAESASKVRPRKGLKSFGLSRDQSPVRK
jgi:hypothetical protein